MNDTDDSLRNRRVPFIYHTLLYKLDNIHLKLNCQRKGHIPPNSHRGNGSEIQELLGGTVLNVSITPGDCGLSSVSQEISYSETVIGLSGDNGAHEHENKDKIFSNDDIGNNILYDSDSDAASDLSIDGDHASINHLSKSISQNKFSHDNNLAQDGGFCPEGKIHDAVTKYDVGKKSTISEEWELEQGRPYSNGDDEILLAHYEKETNERKNKTSSKNEKESDHKTEADCSSERLKQSHLSSSDNSKTDDNENHGICNLSFQRDTKDTQTNHSNNSISRGLRINTGSFNVHTDDRSIEIDEQLYSLKNNKSGKENETMITDMPTCDLTGSVSQNTKFKEHGTGSNNLFKGSATGRQNGIFVKEFDNSFSLISDLLSIGSSPIRQRGSAQNLRKERIHINAHSVGKKYRKEQDEQISYLESGKYDSAGCMFDPDDEKQCSSGNAKKCTKDNEKHCSTDKEKQYTKDNERHRTMDNGKHCTTTNGKYCASENEKHCATDNEKHCTTDKEKHCTTDNTNHCTTSNRKHCARDNENHCTFDTESQNTPHNKNQYAGDHKKEYIPENEKRKTPDYEQQTLGGKRHNISNDEKIDSFRTFEKTHTTADTKKSQKNYKRSHMFASSFPNIVKINGDSLKDWSQSVDGNKNCNLQITRNSNVGYGHSQKSSEKDCKKGQQAEFEHVYVESKEIDKENTKVNADLSDCPKEFEDATNVNHSWQDSSGRANKKDKNTAKNTNEIKLLLRNGTFNTNEQPSLSQKDARIQETITDSSAEYPKQMHDNKFQVNEHETSKTSKEEQLFSITGKVNKSQKSLSCSPEKDSTVGKIAQNDTTAHNDSIKFKDSFQTKTITVDEHITYNSPTHKQNILNAKHLQNETSTESKDAKFVLQDELPLDEQMNDIGQGTSHGTDQETIIDLEHREDIQKETKLEVRNMPLENSIKTETIPVPIIIKRLERPDTSKSNKKNKKEEQGKDPYASFPFRVIPSSTVDSKYLEDFSPKVFAESMANLPLMGEKDNPLTCPTCKTKVFRDGIFIKSDCIDKFHQMLMQMPSLQTVAEEHGLVVRNIASDGNCMFHAVIDQLRIAGDFTFNKDTLRSKSVEYLRENPCQEDGSHLMCFLSTESWEEYLIRMNRDGEWGDHMILNAITEVIGRTVTVLKSSGNVTHLFPHTVTLSDEVTLDSVYLGHVGMHYVSLRPKDWEKTWSMNAKIRRISKYLKERQEMSDLRNDTIVGCNIDKDSLQFGPFYGGNTDILNLLIKEVKFVEPVSRVPVMHLSFILKKMLRLALFSPPHDHPMTLTGGETGMKCKEIGSSGIGLNVRLINYAHTMKEQIKEVKDTCNSKYILFPPDSHYTIVDNEREIPIFKDDVEPHYLVVDTDQTHPGYLRLKTSGPISYVGDSKGGYITKCISGKYYMYRVPVSFFPKDGRKINCVGGLGYGNWPYEAFRWINRDRPAEWPRKETIEEVCKLGCYVRHKSHPGSFEKDVEFQYIFTKAEDILVNDEMTDDMRYCFYVFKALMQFQTKSSGHRLPNYLMTTVLLYACESIPADTWRNSCGGCVMYMIDLFHTWFRQHYFPHYFIKQNNMIDHWYKHDVDKICESIESLRLFPCMVIHFICENYGMGTWTWIIDSVMASSKKFKDDNDACWVVENVFNPTTFYYLGHYLNNPINMEFVFLRLNESFEQNLIWTGTSFDFKAFVDEFLLTVESGKTRKKFTDFVEKELNVVLGHNNSNYITFADFLGPGYKGKYGKNRLNSSHRPIEAIEDFVLSLFLKNEFEQISHIVRCLISNTRQSLETATVNVGDIKDTELKAQIVKSNLNQTTKYLSKLQSYYFIMAICCTKMDKVQLFQEFILEYENVTERLPSKLYFESLSTMWKKLNNPEKAKEVERKMECLLDKEEGHELSRNLARLLIKLSL